MQLEHPGLDREQIIEQILTTPESKKRIVIDDKLGHKSAIALAFERAVVEAAKK